MTMAFPKKIFADSGEDCTCDFEKRQETLDRAEKRVAPFVVDKDGNELFYLDSFGYRGQIPGECDDCYKRMCEARKKAAEQCK